MDGGPLPLNQKSPDTPTCKVCRSQGFEKTDRGCTFCDAPEYRDPPVSKSVYKRLSVQRDEAFWELDKFYKDVGL